MLNETIPETAPSPPPQADAIIQFDILRIAAAAAVICLHVAAGVVLNPGDTLPEWWAGAIADAASRWAVPVFVMISGALLLGDRRRATAAEFYSRRAARLVPPLIFWSVVYLLYRRLDNHTDPAQLFGDIVKGSPSYHLWFLYMLVGLYAITPFLKILVDNNSRTTITVTALAIFAVAAVDLMAIAAAFKGNLPHHTLFVLWLPFTAYFLAGHICSQAGPAASALERP